MSKLLAPNGKPSNLNAKQYKLVRSSAFKKWFGDWENDPKNASKVVDENGEPMICYHATDNKFWEFKKEKQVVGYYGKGFYFSNSLEIAKQYGKRVIPAFLNIKSVFELSDETPQELLNQLAEANVDIVDLGEENDIEQRSKYTFGYASENSDIFMNNLIKNGYYGIRMIYDLESSTYFFIVFEPNQIKLADGTNTTFDIDNPDIRFDKGGEVFNNLSKKSKEIIDANYDGRGSFGLYDFDWNKESERENYFEWLKDFKENQFKKNLSKVIKQVESDIKLKNEKEKSEIKLKYFEKLIIPSLGNEVLIPKLSVYEKQVLLDPNATIESIQKGFIDAKNIIDEDGSINQSKITPSNFIEDDEINLPAFEKFVEKNPQYKGVFNDWKKILDEYMNISLKQSYAFRYPSIDDLEYLHSELVSLKDEYSTGGAIKKVNIVDIKQYTMGGVNYRFVEIAEKKYNKIEVYRQYEDDGKYWGVLLYRRVPRYDFKFSSPMINNLNQLFAYSFRNSDEELFDAVKYKKKPFGSLSHRIEDSSEDEIYEKFKFFIAQCSEYNLEYSIINDKERIIFQFCQKGTFDELFNIDDLIEDYKNNGFEDIELKGIKKFRYYDLSYFLNNEWDANGLFEFPLTGLILGIPLKFTMSILNMWTTYDLSKEYKYSENVIEEKYSVGGEIKKFNLLSDIWEWFGIKF